MSGFYLKTVFALLVSAVIVTSASASSYAQTSRLYLAGYMGLNMPFDSNFSDTDSGTSGDIQYDNAVSFAGALGLRLSHNVRLEGEIAYKSNSADTIDFSTTGQVPLEGKLKSFTGLMNVYYDFDVPWKVQPYIGAGLGFGWFEGDISAPNGPSFVKDTTNLIWNAGAGIKYRTRSNVAFTAGYRYLDSTDLDFGSANVDYSDHEIRVGIEYDLN